MAITDLSDLMKSPEKTRRYPVLLMCAAVSLLTASADAQTGSSPGGGSRPRSDGSAGAGGSAPDEMLPFDELMKLPGEGRSSGTDSLPPVESGNATRRPVTPAPQQEFVPPRTYRESQPPNPFSEPTGRPLDRRPLEGPFRGADQADGRAGDPGRRLLPAERETDDPGSVDLEFSALKFDWQNHSTSIADLRFPTLSEFEDGRSSLFPEEEEAYLDLVATVERQRALLIQRTSRERQSTVRPVAVWEEAFYQFANARRLAWENGHLRKPDSQDSLNGMADPFRNADPSVSQLRDDSSRPYSLLDDIRRFPEHFAGRPIVLYGRLSPGKLTRITDDPQTVQSSGRGVRDEFQEVLVHRSSLRSLADGAQIAVVDFRSVTTPDEGTIRTEDWAGDSVAVLVKGWVVKDWNGVPLIFSESVRKLSAIPHFELIRRNTFDRRRLQDEEKWLYYETLRQLELTTASQQKLIADFWLARRINQLKDDVGRKAKADLQALNDQLSESKITETQYRQGKTTLERSVAARVARYRQFRDHPEDFQTYVDMFQYPEAWHGQMVTLSGHVRHVVSYPGDETLFDGRMLHELWLFTDDSQHNPTVIITPTLPTDFPADAEVIDSVSVTGCFFKRYVYGSQDAARIAPLLLAGRISWVPTASQVATLVNEGNLDGDSPRAKRAEQLQGEQSGDSIALFVSLAVVLALMILWGRAQREERDRVRLRKRIDEVPEFESTQPGGYAIGLSDLPLGSNDGV